MANYTQSMGGFNAQQPMPIYYPQGNNNLITNTPYDNYMGRTNQQNSFNQQQFLKCRPVSSRQEAMASQISLDGALWVFTDINNGKIYTKQINNDGTASFNTYCYMKEEIPSTTSNQFVTKEEFNKVIQNLVAAIGSSQPQSGSLENNSSLPAFK